MEPQSEATLQTLPDASRRSFLGLLLGSASTCIGAFIGVPVMRYIFYPLTARSKNSGWTDAGSISEVVDSKKPVRRTLNLTQRDGWQETASEPVIYVIQTAVGVKALSAICPHLGCTVAWNDEKDKFVCPCHGGVFAADGAHCSGPPPRSLDALESKVVDGKLMVRYEQFRPNVPTRQVTV